MFGGSLSPQHGASSGRGLAANTLTDDKGWASSLGVGRGAKLPLTIKNKLVTKHKHEPRTWTDALDKRPKRRNISII
jgi:hypothetical protein